MSGKNSNIVKSVGVAGQPVADRVGCAETFEDRIQCAVGAAARRQVSAPGCASQLVENRGALRDIIRVAHVNAVIWTSPADAASIASGSEWRLIVSSPSES